MAEQLYYTWAKRGPSGSGFQVVAASDGLADRWAPLTQIALRYCRYQPPERADSAEMPTSFGWSDDEGFRVVFRRVSMEHVHGARGAFFAHIIIGHAKELPTPIVSSWYASEQWWTYDRETWDDSEFFRLPVLDPQDVRPGALPLASDSAGLSFLSALLEFTAPPLALSVDPAQAAGLVAMVERALPGILERYSFSTYEAAQHAIDFSIVGVRPGGPIPIGATPWEPNFNDVSNSTARIASAFLQGDLPNELARSALTLASSEGGVSRTRLIKAAKILLAVDSGQDVSFDEFADLLESPTSITAIISHTSARNILGKAIAQNERKAWQAMQSWASSVGSEYLSILGHVVAKSIAEAGRMAHLGDYFERAHRVSSKFALGLGSGVWRVLLMTPSLAADLDGVGCVGLLRLSVLNDGQQVVADTVMSRAYRAQVDVANARDLNIEWRTAAVAQYFLSSRSISPFIGLLISDEALLKALVPQLPSPDPVLQMVGELSQAQAEHVAFLLAPGLDSLNSSSLLRSLYGRTPIGDKLGFIERWARANVGSLSDRDQLLSLTIADSVRRRADNVMAEAGLTDVEQAVLRIVKGPRSDKWVVVGIDTDWSQWQPRETISLIASKFDNETPAERGAAIEIGLDAGISHLQSTEQLRELVRAYREMGGLYSGDLVRRLMVATRRAVQQDESCPARKIIMGYFQDLHEKGALEFNESDILDGLRSFMSDIDEKIPYIVTESITEASGAERESLRKKLDGVTDRFAWAARLRKPWWGFRPNR